MIVELDRHAALIHTMVLVSAAEGQISDTELETMSRIVRYVPAFADFNAARIDEICTPCVELLAEEDGIELALERIGRALPQPLRETAYALACDVAASEGKVSGPAMRLLELIRLRLEVDRLVAAAIERAALARHRPV